MTPRTNIVGKRFALLGAGVAHELLVRMILARGGHICIEAKFADIAVVDAGSTVAGLIDTYNATLPMGAAKVEIWTASRLAQELVTTVDGLRPSVLGFARLMEETLRKHDATKGGQSDWLRDEPAALFDRIYDELEETAVAAASGDESAAASEVIDAANFCLMYYDRLKGLPKDPEPV